MKDEQIRKLDQTIDALVTVWQGFSDLTDDEENKIIDAENMLRDKLKKLKSL